MKKFLKIVLIGIPLLIIIVAVAAYFGLNSIVEAGVEKIGPKITKTDINMESVSIMPFNGRGEITNFVIGNPEGFKSESAIKAKNVIVDVEPKSVLSDVIVVNEIVVEEPQITVEQGLLGKNNLLTIKNNIGEFSEGMPGGEGEQPSEKETGEQQKIIIKHFAVRGGKVRVALKDLGGAGATMPLQDVDERDIGTETGGVTLGEAAERTLGILIGQVTATVGKSGDFAGDTGKTAGDAIEGAVKGVGDAIGGLFGKKKEEAPKDESGAQ